MKFVCPSPPKKVEPAHKEEIQKIFEESLEEEKKFSFATLSSDKSISVPVDGDKFFNKHIAIVGSTGSGIIIPNGLASNIYFLLGEPS